MKNEVTFISLWNIVFQEWYNNKELVAEEGQGYIELFYKKWREFYVLFQNMPGFKEDFCSFKALLNGANDFVKTNPIYDKCTKEKIAKSIKIIWKFVNESHAGTEPMIKRYCVFTNETIRSSSYKRTSSKHRFWIDVLEIYAKRYGRKNLKKALSEGIIIGYTPVIVEKQYGSEAPGTSNEISKKGQTIQELSDIKLLVYTKNPEIKNLIVEIFSKIKEQLFKKESYLVKYKLRSVSHALLYGVLWAIPCIIFAYIADYYLHSIVFSVGLARIFWKSCELIIRYIEGYADTIMQWISMRAKFKKKEVDSHEYLPSKAGVVVSFLGPLSAILFPIFGISEVSRLYSIVATINATADNATSAIYKAGSWISLSKKNNSQITGGVNIWKTIFLDPYIYGNLLGSFLIFLLDFKARSIISGNYFDFLRIVAVEGLLLGCLDSEVATLASKISIWYNEYKFRRFANNLILNDLTISPQKRKD